jgi:hypothetical protein
MNLPAKTRPKDERYNVLRSAAERALTGWPEMPVEQMTDRVKDPKKDKSTVPAVRVPNAPRVASRTMPGTTPMKTKGF